MAQTHDGVHRRGFLAGAGVLVLAGCTSSPDPAPAPAPEALEPPPTVTLTAAGVETTPAADPPARASAPLRVRPALSAAVAGGTLVGVVVRPAAGKDGTAGAGEPVAGSVDADGTWTCEQPLALAGAYEAVATATNSEGATATARLAFTTVGEDDAVRAKMMPLPGESVGVGMPVVLYLTKPIADDQRRALTDATVVERPDGIEGAWRWFSDTEAHWRPREYWPAGTSVRVVVPLTSLDVGGGIFGAEDRDFTFTVGDAHTSVVDADTHQMTTSVNGVVARTFPVSCGREDDDPSYITRSGVHLVLAKHADFLMDGATVGLDYATDVKWATRLSNSGEFVHGAPWSVADQGVRNVSHGCVNAADADAKWFHDLSLRGDPVDVVGTDRPMELTNGLGDWVLGWEEWTGA